MDDDDGDPVRGSARGRGEKLAIDTIRWRIQYLAPEAYGKAVGEEEGKGGFNVQVVKFSDLTPRERAQYPSHEW